jgi:hypothetical protein
MIVIDDSGRKGRKLPWTVLKNYIRIYLKKLCKIVKNFTAMITGVRVENK